MSFRVGSTIRANYIFFNLLFLILFLVFQRNGMTILLFMVWMNMVIFACNKLSERIVLLVFLISFFAFLLGREFLEVFFQYKPEEFSDEIFRHTNKLLIFSLLSMFVSYFLCEGFIFSKEILVQKRDELFNKSLRDITEKAFFVLAVLMIIYTIIEIRFVLKNGYYAYYVYFKQKLSENTLLFFLSKVELLVNVSICCFFATFPDKKAVDRLSVVYCVCICMGIFTGARSSFVLGILFLFIYYAYRNVLDPIQGFITKKTVITLCLLTPAMILGLGMIGYIRGGEGTNIGNFLRIIPDFIYDQGVSINVIKRGYQYKDFLRKDRMYSLGFLRTGIFSLIFSRSSMGNSMSNGLEGYQFTHALSYILLGEAYLKGRGLGTSYIAELFHDFGMKGIIAGNIVLSYVVCAARKFASGNILLRIVKLLIIQSILWMPRGSVGEILSLLFSPFTLITVFSFLCLAKINLRRL